MIFKQSFILWVYKINLNKFSVEIKCLLEFTASIHYTLKSPSSSQISSSRHNNQFFLSNAKRRKKKVVCAWGTWWWRKWKMKNGHYKWMWFILKIAFSLIVTTRQYVGNPIDCVHTKDIPEDVLNTYCWIHSTYALKSMFLKKTGKEVPYPGVGNSEGKTEDRKVYKYYQWVCFCLFFQVINILF